MTDEELTAKNAEFDEFIINKCPCLLYDDGDGYECTYDRENCIITYDYAGSYAICSSDGKDKDHTIHLCQILFYMFKGFTFEQMWEALDFKQNMISWVPEYSNIFEDFMMKYYPDKKNVWSIELLLNKIMKD